MTDFSSDRAASLPDAEVLDLVVALTSARPALRAVYDAALGLTPEASVDPDVVPRTPSVNDIPQMGGGSPTGFTDAGVPTFDAVRERIDGRSGRAVGSTELDAESTIGRTEAEKFAERERAGSARLDEIRKSMRKNP
ncbi:hypothetical protein HQ325_11005 [Rhodococcus sp. BP-349]|uniref:PspA/IM30 family protein n=1 Tax=unclassified Rhodococcus (in: high G+C Gram-positive bacteria) TaxID=192944 RepID=UPI001C9A3021|nr:MULTISPECIES: hypothetical protein [unclassified Rhodococcus (in: high G+C Gram-positive bacteria)]MBY6539200.1 hypothetical protein [Rhodococcus sp. BP-363]MBY6544472.1 hypothetical protein [Rhodococcus sp. BP-369]MBY6563702.1 hypothetical protein [Rhodococcus sp. BP-370]MBY6577994.1 hypothetical protein [Rhodococcus sp. BP-364]MBY6587295.1 hypothetical protein [Rhodococcus sp. BP-358]